MNTRLWVTYLTAVDPKTMELKKWAGPWVPGLDSEDAQTWCENQGLGYLTVAGELTAQIEWDGSETDFEEIRSN